MIKIYEIVTRTDEVRSKTGWKNSELIIGIVSIDRGRCILFF